MFFPFYFVQPSDALTKTSWKEISSCLAVLKVHSCHYMPDFENNFSHSWKCLPFHDSFMCMTVVMILRTKPKVLPMKQILLLLSYIPGNVCLTKVLLSFPSWPGTWNHFFSASQAFGINGCASPFWLIILLNLSTCTCFLSNDKGESKRHLLCLQ